MVLVAVLMAIVVAIVGGGFYMLDYSLAPDAERTDTASCFREQFKAYPETKPWVDSLRRRGALRDTFVMMPTGERHHALYVKTGSNKTALVLHGWRGCSIDFLFLARLYERELGYNVVLPDFHAHGLSEGQMIQMGWLDRKDMLYWLSVFESDTMVVHGVSMGGATTMMMSAEEQPEGIKDLRFIDDCGYTSVWDEVSGDQHEQGLLQFVIPIASWWCGILHGWTFSEASPLNMVKKSYLPMFFIHGDDDAFVPTWMVHPLYEAKPEPKEIWLAPGSQHARSYFDHPEEYTAKVQNFLAKYVR